LPEVKQSFRGRIASAQRYQVNRSSLTCSVLAPHVGLAHFFQGHVSHFPGKSREEGRQELRDQHHSESRQWLLIPPIFLLRDRLLPTVCALAWIPVLRHRQ